MLNAARFAPVRATGRRPRGRRRRGALHLTVRRSKLHAGRRTRACRARRVSKRAWWAPQLATGSSVCYRRRHGSAGAVRAANVCRWGGAHHGWRGWMARSARDPARECDSY